MMYFVVPVELKIIEYYHAKGYEYQAIVLFLEKYHGISLSLRTLKRRLKDYGLRKKQVNVDHEQLHNNKLILR